MSDQGEQDPGVNINFGPGGEESAPSPDDLANPYLSSIPEVDRNVVAKYIKGWQGQVTQRFQAIHDQYRPFKDMDPDEVQRAQAVYELLDQRPEEVLRVMIENAEDNPQIAQILQGYGQQGQQQYQQPGQFENPWADAGVPDDFANMFIQQQQVLAALADKVMGQDSRYVEEQEAAQLDSVLDDLHSRYGDFDEDPVLLRMYQGMDPDSAVRSYGESIQQEINRRSSAKPPPMVLGGNGSVPHGGVDPSKMEDKDRRNYIAQQLQAVIDNQ